MKLASSISFFSFSLFDCEKIRDGAQNFKRPNLERPIFRNSKSANIKITKNELSDVLIFLSPISRKTKKKRKNFQSNVYSS